MRENNLRTAQTENTRHALRRLAVAGLAGTLLLMLAMFVAPTPSSARVSVGISVGFGPPALPVYMQPPCPAPGYMWTPGYWAWDPAYGYYWVPGTWVPAPFVGAMWTPGYWGFYDGGYRWHGGYWGLSVGFYGGINYGFGYTGYGYYGGYWNRDHFYYNRNVNRLEGRDFRHVYNRRVEDRFRDRRVSYNGGRGGINARPTRGQMAAERGRRSGPVNQQLRHQQFARRDPAQRARENHGRPGVAATRRPGAFRDNGAVRATRAGEPYRAPVERTRNGRESSRSAPQRGNNDRGFHSFSQQGNAQPNRRQENRAPVQQRAERQVQRNNSPRNYQQAQQQSRPQEMRRVENRPAPQRVERQVNRNNAPRNYQRSQQQSRPQQTRRVESRPAPQQRGNASRQEARGGGNGHGGDSAHGHGRGGRH
jgi:WXXGXW repeat (2 copies)